MASSSYIVKLLTMLVRKSGGCVRIPATELMSSDLGQGIRVWWDDKTKELVVDFMPSGATVYVINERETWLGKQAPQEPIQPQLPKSQDELIAKIWKDSAATQTTQELASSRHSKVIRPSDEDLALAEMETRKREIIKEIESFQTPTQSRPAVTPSGTRTTFYKQ